MEHENGRRTEGAYRAGKKAGEWRVYADDGSVEAVETWGDNGRQAKRPGQPVRPFPIQGSLAFNLSFPETGVGFDVQAAWVLPTDLETSFEGDSQGRFFALGLVGSSVWVGRSPCLGALCARRLAFGPAVRAGYLWSKFERTLRPFASTYVYGEAAVLGGQERTEDAPLSPSGSFGLFGARLSVGVTSTRYSEAVLDLFLNDGNTSGTACMISTIAALNHLELSVEVTHGDRVVEIRPTLSLGVGF